MNLIRYFILSSAIIIAGCSTNSNSYDDCCAPPNADITFSIVDEQGQDRLNPDHDHSLSEQNIDPYYVDGEEKEPGSAIEIFQSENTGIYVLQLFLSNYIGEDGKTTTLLEFPNGTVDTLKMEPLRDEGSATDKLWYDGKLVYDVDDPELFEITKSVAEN